MAVKRVCPNKHRSWLGGWETDQPDKMPSYWTKFKHLGGGVYEWKYFDLTNRGTPIWRSDCLGKINITLAGYKPTLLYRFQPTPETLEDYPHIGEYVGHPMRLLNYDPMKGFYVEVNDHHLFVSREEIGLPFKRVTRRQLVLELLNKQPGVGYTEIKTMLKANGYSTSKYAISSLLMKMLAPPQPGDDRWDRLEGDVKRCLITGVGCWYTWYGDIARQPIQRGKKVVYKYFPLKGVSDGT